jgi:ribose/xylose/arabinose/galactoside ABC-type transport system permease subunit
MFGLNYILSGARPIYGRMPEAFVFLGNGHLGPIPFPAIILVLAYVLGYFVLHRSRYGHYLFAIGDNMESAYAAGINVRWLKMTTFLISSGCAAMAGFLHTAWIGSGQPQVGPSYLMEAMAAVFFGCAIGRRGNTSLWGSLQGITVMAILAKGVNILGQPFWLQQIAAGILLLGSLFAMHWSKRRREARKALEQV